ncbi:Fc.00g037620.m01.CDS01 [Cosmosporella sp. VM-42]
MLDAQIERHPSHRKPGDLNAGFDFNSCQFQVWASPYIGNRLFNTDSLFDYPNEIDAIGVVVNIVIDRKTYKRMRRVDHHSHQGFILPTTPVSTNPGLVTGCALKQDQVDYGVVQQWLQECDEHHRACTRSHTTIPGLQVIDCTTGKVVSISDDSHYLALSYVWGVRSRRDSLIRKFNSSVKKAYFPRTVRDAMHVTRSLGYHFLWVDQYCINQDDAAQKAQQIAIMDKIYEEASVTIVAASGDGDEYGLAGAGTSPSVPRDAQLKAQVGNRELVWTLPALFYELKKTKWATRGWTYQEAMLSNRCLVFTNSQVFLACKTTTRYETIPHMPQTKRWDERELKYRNKEATIDNMFDDGLFGGGTWYDQPTSGLGFFQRHATMYLSRSLTYDSDALNAFLGILGRSKFPSYWGIPLVFGLGSDRGAVDEPGKTCTPLSAFIRGLVWFAGQSNHPRRDTAPSWSWVSLQKTSVELRQDPDAKLETPGWRIVTRSPDVNIWCRDKNDSVWEPLASNLSTDDHVIQFSGPQLLIQTYVGTVEKLEKTTEEYSDPKQRKYIIHVDGFASEHQGLSTFLDCRESLQESESADIETWYNPGWAVALLNILSYWSWPYEAYDEERKVGNCPIENTGMEEQAYLLVLEKGPDDTWRRIGIAQGAVDLDKLKLETLVLC